MGILKEPAGYVKALQLPAGFSVCELGDQMMSGGKMPTPAVDFYRALGCGRYEAIDGNGRGTFTWDLNQPVPQMAGRFAAGFDLVTDFGTGEHIFDQAQVWRTIHELTKTNGFIVFDRPTQGYVAHCFYNIDAGLVEDLAAANHYDVERLAIVETPRGRLVRGVLRKRSTGSFVIPQQGRYQKDLRLTGVA